MINISDKDLEDARANDNKDYKTIVPGGYVCKILKAEIDQYNHLRVEYEIVEGDLKGYAADYRENTGKDFSPIFDSFALTDNAKWKVAQLINAVTDTNSKFVWDGNEAKLVNKGVGIVFGMEECKDGKERCKPRKYISANDARTGNFKVPTDVKPFYGKKAEEPAPEAPAVEDEDLPF